MQFCGFQAQAQASDLCTKSALKEVDRVVVVLRQASPDCEDVGVEDDVLGVEADLLDQDLERPTADAHLQPEQHGFLGLVADMYPGMYAGMYRASARCSQTCVAECAA